MWITILGTGALAALAFAQPGTAAQPLESYGGRWNNPGGPLLATLEVQVSDRGAVLHAWGHCPASSCDWGTVDAEVYRDVSPQRTAGALSALYVRNAVEHRLIMRLVTSDRLGVDVLSRSPDDPSRNTFGSLHFDREGARQLSLRPVAEQPARSPGAVRVGGNIREPVKVKHVPPAYPEAAKANRLQGLVVLECTIGPDGSVVELRPLRGEHQVLIDAAIETVKQWRYTPTLVNGVAVPVIMTVTVNYKLG